MILRYCTLSNQTSGFQASTIGISAMNGYGCVWKCGMPSNLWPIELGKYGLKQMGFGDIPWVVKQTQTEIFGIRGGNLKIKPRQLSKQTWDIIIKIGYQTGKKIWFKPKPETGQRPCANMRTEWADGGICVHLQLGCVFFQNIKETLV
jgi:hypothetical protein